MPSRKKSAAKAAPQQSRAIGVGEVTTPETPQEPTGIYWDRLKSARSPTQLQKLKDDATAHGYAHSGQLMQAITKKMQGV